MNRHTVITGTVTYAIKGRDLLQKKGYKAKIEKTASGKGNVGCGYGIVIEGDIALAEKLLRDSGIKILEITAG